MTPTTSTREPLAGQLVFKFLHADQGDRKPTTSTEQGGYLVAKMPEVQADRPPGR